MGDVGEEFGDARDLLGHELFAVEEFVAQGLATRLKLERVFGHLGLRGFGGRGGDGGVHVFGELPHGRENGLVGRDLCEGFEHPVGKPDDAGRGGELGELQERQRRNGRKHRDLVVGNELDVAVGERIAVVLHREVDLVGEVDVGERGLGGIETLVLLVALVDHGFDGKRALGGVAED